MKARPANSSPRAQATPRAKRDELQTYRELKLGRDLKSIRARRRVEAKGAHRVVGDGSIGQPRLIVDAKRYREVRLIHERELLAEARRMELRLPIDRLREQLAPRVEALTYAQLAAEARHEIAGQVPLAALGRALTKDERAHFVASDAVSPGSSRAAPAPTRAGYALQKALGQIEDRQAHNPARYQTIWAQVVGPDAAAQSHLERIDPATKIAWFRCYNSVLSTDLQRRSGLAAKLAKAIGLPIRQLRAQF